MVSQSGSLEEKVRALESKQLAAEEATAEKARHAPFLSVGADGFALSSADTNFVLRLRGILQVDSRTFLDDNPLSTGNDGFLIRRARPIIEGRLFRDFDFQLMPDLPARHLNFSSVAQLPLPSGTSVAGGEIAGTRRFGESALGLSAAVQRTLAGQ
jgi:phosphate-selective porin OprO/OprP